MKTQSEENAALQKRNGTLIALLRDTDRRMAGNELYEHGWVNHPEKPERSAADYVREVINPQPSN